MHRRPLGRGRVLVVVASVLMLVACLPLLPWFGTGGGSDLPARQLTAFDGSGILVFLAALLTVALVSLPYALVDRPVALDSWPTYLVLLGVAAAGLVLWPLDLLGVYPAGLLPDRAPGFALATVGVLIYARAVYEIHQVPRT